MGNKVIIDGKEYTERTISSIEIDGIKSNQQVIPPQSTKVGGTLNVTINLQEDKIEEPNLSKMEALKSNSVSSNEQSSVLEVDKSKEGNQWIKKIVNLIKKLFS